MRLCIAVALAVLAAWGQDFRRLVFQAVDGKTGAVAGGLQAEDLEVVEGETVRPLSSLRFGASPMDIVLVLDTGPHGIEIARAVVQGARLACSEFDPGDRLAFITFASGVKLRFSFAARDGDLARRMERAVDAAAWSRALKVYDAVQAAVELFPGTPDLSRSRAVLLITNSLDQGSRAEPALIRQAARSKNVALFTVSVRSWRGVYRERLPSDPAKLTAERMRPLAEATGGEARVCELSGYILRESFERMRSRYVAAYIATPGSALPLVLRLSPRGAVAFSNIVFRGAW